VKIITDLPEFIDNLTKKVEGKNASRDVTIFTLSTCQWCKKCKRYLNEREIQYRYIDIDKIDPSEKAKILQYLRQNYQNRISYPFLVCDDKFVVGYNPGTYEELMREEGN
jgi:glutaredoxin